MKSVTDSDRRRATGTPRPPTVTVTVTRHGRISFQVTSSLTQSAEPRQPLRIIISWSRSRSQSVLPQSASERQCTVPAASVMASDSDPAGSSRCPAARAAPGRRHSAIGLSQDDSDHDRILKQHAVAAPVGAGPMVHFLSQHCGRDR